MQENPQLTPAPIISNSPVILPQATQSPMPTTQVPQQLVSTNIEPPVAKSKTNGGIAFAFIFLILLILAAMAWVFYNSDTGRQLFGRSTDNVLVGDIEEKEEEPEAKDVVENKDSTDYITDNVNIFPTLNEFPSYTSKELAITFFVPTGVVIKEVEHHFNAQGCLNDTNYPSYQAIEAYMNGKKLLFIGVNGDCGAVPIADEAPFFSKKVNGVYYTLVKAMAETPEGLGYMRIPVKFGSSSKVAPLKVGSNDALMIAEEGQVFTQGEFDAAVTIIASIKQLD